MAAVGPADALEDTEDVVPELFVELGCLEIVGVEQHLRAATRAGFVLSGKQQVLTKPLATHVFSHPEVADLQIASPGATSKPGDDLPRVVALEDRQRAPIVDAR